MHFSSAFKPFVHLMCVYHKVDMYWCFVCTNWPVSVCWVEACVCICKHGKKREMGGISIGREFFMLTCAHIVLYKQKLRWMWVLLLFTGQLCFPRGTLCPYATSKSSQCGSHPCDIKTYHILYKTMLSVCVSCVVNNERNVSSSFPAQMVPCPPLVENAAEEEGE